MHDRLDVLLTPAGRTWRGRRARTFELALRRLLERAGVTPASTSATVRRGGYVRLEAGRRASARIRRVQEYVEANVGAVRTLDELAEVAGLSRFHFARRFRTEVGEPPWAFVRRVRTDRAQELLRDGLPPAETAHALGFADQAHLTRAVRERFGRTPGQIRREGRTPVPPEPAAPQADGKDVQDAPAGAA